MAGPYPPPPPPPLRADGSGPWQQPSPLELRILKLEGELEQLEEQLGRVESLCTKLVLHVGEAPDDATGKVGSGMSRVIAEHVRGGGPSLKALGLTGAGAVGVAQVLAELVRWWMGAG